MTKMVVMKMMKMMKMEQQVFVGSVALKIMGERRMRVGGGRWRNRPLYGRGVGATTTTMKLLLFFTLPE